MITESRNFNAEHFRGADYECALRHCDGNTIDDHGDRGIGNADVSTGTKINIAYKDRNCVITKAFLDYIKTIEIESDPRGNFVISLDRFNKELPIFNNPLKETNIINFVNRVAGIVETNKDKITDPYEKLELLMHTVHEKFKCNLTVLQVIIYATTAFNPMGGNFRLGRNSPVKA